MNTATATLVKKLDSPIADQRLYRLTDTGEYVVVSAVWAFDSGMPETFIFPADADGNITSYLELPGSFRGELNHNKALANAGYEVKP